VSTGASFETLSNMTRDAVETIADAPGIKHGIDGKPLISAEALAIVRLPLKRADNSGNVSLRGVNETTLLCARIAIGRRPPIRVGRA